MDLSRVVVEHQCLQPANILSCGGKCVAPFYWGPVFSTHTHAPVLLDRIETILNRVPAPCRCG
jgi:hypothetical protein